MLDTKLSPDGIFSATLNRPDVHNAFNAELIAELTKAFDRAASDPHVRVVILSGEGKSFSAGADLNWMRKAIHFTEEENQADAEDLAAMLTSLYICPVPVFVLAHGAVMGGAVGLLACADTVIAVDGTKFALSETKIGLTPATISPFVMRAIGERWSRRLFTTAERFDCAIATQCGLIHETVPDLETAKARIIELAEMVTTNAPGAVMDAKRLVLDLADEPITAELRTETARRIAERRISAEGQEGLTAFLDKRQPAWRQ